jgi:predicted anti-sigma-YlaC factor YlaD
MISCRQLAELLFDFSYDQIPLQQRACVEQHLCVCSSCVAYVESYRRLIRLARQLPRAPLPPHLAEKIRALLEEAGRAQSVGDASHDSVKE